MTLHAERYAPAADEAMGDVFLRCIAVVLLGYALFNKGFAYLGFPPLFVAEIMLAFGAVVALSSRHWQRLFEIKPLLAVIPLVGWGLFRTIPYVGSYGIDALRDGTVYGYSAFGVVLALLLVADPTRLAVLLTWYRKYWRIFLIGVPIVFILFRFFRGVLPYYPWANGVSLIYVKEGDLMVLLGAVLAFWVSGFEKKVSWGWFLLMAFCVATVGVVDRAGMLAYLAVMTLCLLIKPRHSAAWRLITIACLAVFMLWLSSVAIEIPGGKGRDISFRQVKVNLYSMLGADSGDAGTDSNRDWRLNWWTDVVDYTFKGPYFWMGKGYGVNLADDDGYQLFQDSRLRSPHSAHITFLARGGVPGLVLWLLVPVTWGYSILRAYLRAKRDGDVEWEATFSFIGAFGIALLINASFDVYLEGPMGGVWFWCVYGVGLGALWIYQNHPEVLLDDALSTDDVEDIGPVHASLARSR